MDSASYSPIMPSQDISFMTNDQDQINITKLEREYPSFVPAKMVDILYAIKVCESYVLSVKDNLNRNIKMIDSNMSPKGISKLASEVIQGNLLRMFEELVRMQLTLQKAYKYTNKDCSKDWTMRELKEFFNSIPEKDLDNKIDESVLRLLFSL